MKTNSSILYKLPFLGCLAVITVIMMQTYMRPTSTGTSSNQPLSTNCPLSSFEKPNANPKPIQSVDSSYASSFDDEQKLINLMKTHSTPTLQPMTKINSLDVFQQPSTSNTLSLPTLPIPQPHHQQNDSFTPTQRCIYNNQPYVLGDMVKSDLGWLRCSPTVYFSEENPVSQQTGNAAWVKVQ